MHHDDQQRGTPDAANGPPGDDAGAQVREELAEIAQRTHDGIPAAPQGDGAGDELARTGTHGTTNPEVGEVGA